MATLIFPEERGAVITVISETAVIPVYFRLIVCDNCSVFCLPIDIPLDGKLGIVWEADWSVR